MEQIQRSHLEKFITDGLSIHLQKRNHLEAIRDRAMFAAAVLRSSGPPNEVDKALWESSIQECQIYRDELRTIFKRAQQILPGDCPSLSEWDPLDADDIFPVYVALMEACMKATELMERKQKPKYGTCRSLAFALLTDNPFLSDEEIALRIGCDVTAFTRRLKGIQVWQAKREYLQSKTRKRRETGM